MVLILQIKEDNLLLFYLQEVEFHLTTWEWEQDFQLIILLVLQ
jgi:hypothetical protein